MKNSQPIKYELVTSKCRTDGAEGATVYGVKISSNCSNYLKFEDISTNQADVERLIILINKGNVEPNQLLYIIEDFIAE